MSPVHGAQGKKLRETNKTRSRSPLVSFKVEDLLTALPCCLIWIRSCFSRNFAYVMVYLGQKLLRLKFNFFSFLKDRRPEHNPLPGLYPAAESRPWEIQDEGRELLLWMTKGGYRSGEQNLWWRMERQSFIHPTMMYWRLSMAGTRLIRHWWVKQRDKQPSQSLLPSEKQTWNNQSRP